MNRAEIWLTIAISLGSLMFIVSSALLRQLVVAIRRQTKTEDSIADLAEDVKKLVVDKDKVHSEMLEQMRFDRAATDKRLRELENFFMDLGKERFRGDHRN